MDHREDPEGLVWRVQGGDREASVAGAGWTEECQRLDQRSRQQDLISCGPL